MWKDGNKLQKTEEQNSGRLNFYKQLAYIFETQL